MNKQILKSEVILDVIPIYKNELYPTKDKMYHFSCIIDPNENGIIEILDRR